MKNGIVRYTVRMWIKLVLSKAVYLGQKCYAVDYLHRQDAAALVSLDLMNDLGSPIST